MTTAGEVADWLDSSEGRIEDLMLLWAQGRRSSRWVAEQLIDEGHLARLGFDGEAARSADEARQRVVDAARDYSPREAHDWRCEYRTAESGWKPGDPPVIVCECGYDELQAALTALDTEAGNG